MTELIGRVAASLAGDMHTFVIAGHHKVFRICPVKKSLADSAEGGRRAGISVRDPERGRQPLGYNQAQNGHGNGK